MTSLDEKRTNVRIAIYAFDGITMFHLAAPLLVFGEVSRLQLADGWSTVVWTETGARIRTAEGLMIDGVTKEDAARDADILVLPSWPADLPHPDKTLVDTIRSAHAVGTKVVGLCLGAFPVVRSGILDARSAVTHWEGAVRLAEAHPRVHVQSAALYIDHGDVLTSAGTASSLDACLHIVRTHLGSAAAAAVARHLVIAPHREGDQAQYIERPIPAEAGIGPIGDAMSWVLSNLDQSIAIADLATRVQMSERNFSRRFQQTTGVSPARWILARRLDEARRLLEMTSWTIAHVAEACGFASAVTFRQNFVEAYATTPTSYRKRFTDAAAPNA